MKKLEDLDLQHEQILKDKFNHLKIDISEYTFANLYLFRKFHDYKIFFDKELFIQGLTRDKKKYLMPTIDLSKSSVEDIQYWLKDVDFFFPIPEEWIEYFDPNIFHSSYLENESDYLFKLEKIQTYSGRHLSKKRNLVKQLLEEYEVNDYELTSEYISEAMNILNLWQDNQPLPREETDFYPCQEALTLIDKLKLKGRIYYINQKAVAFVLGEKLNDQMMIHFSKADKHIKGLYQYTYQTFAKRLDNSIEYINMEQDLGLPQVHQTKHSYQPDKMIKKWRVTKNTT